MVDPVKFPWTKGDLTIARAVLEQVFAEARAAYGRDEESCGLLFGPEGDARALDAMTPLENRANKLHALDPETYPRTGRMYFDIDPMKFNRALEQGKKDGRPAKVLYHSHLDVGAYFSETDAMTATLGGDEPAYPLAYLVTSVRGDGKGGGAQVDDHKLFVWDAGARAFVESPLRVVDG